MTKISNQYKTLEQYLAKQSAVFGGWMKVEWK
jgi:hypothetical protein